MASIGDGGPAFPCQVWVEYDQGNGTVHHKDERRSGLTMRDYFAAQAMAGSLGGVPGTHLSPDNLARESYAHADAMLKAREQK